jgi:hypothetical protein
MSNTKFWGQSGTINLDSNSKNTIKSPGAKKTLKGLSTFGGVLIALVAVVVIAIYFFIVKPATVLMSSVNVLKTDSSSISNALSSRDLVALDSALTKTQNDLNTTRTERDKEFGWTKTVTLFKINEYYSDSDHFIDAGLDAVKTLRDAETIVRPFADAAGLKVSQDQKTPANTGLMKAFQSWVSIMPQVATQMDGVIADVAKIGNDLKPVDVSKYPKEFRGVPIRDNIQFAKDTLSKASDYAPDIKQALLVFPKILAVGTPVKRYMIIMQNDKEIRPTGGFMTNYATFKVANGLLDSDFTSKDMYSVDLILMQLQANGRYYDFPDAPPAYTKYLKVEHWYARDMNSDPDFPTSMDQFLKFYNMAGTINPVEVKPVDGIISIDTNVISQLLAVTGPVTVNGVTYTSDNVVLELEKIASLQLQEQANRKKVLGDLMGAMLKNVFESNKDLWPKLIQTGVTLAEQKHIQAYVFDTDIQALLEKYNFAGRVVDPVTGDYSMVVSTNLGGDKTNWFVTKDVTHQVTNSGGKWLVTETIKYTYPQPAAVYSPFVKMFRDWARIYAPTGSQFISVDGSQDASMSGTERDKVWFSGTVELEPNQTKTLVFKYYLPDGVVNTTSGKYNLYLEKQGGIGPEQYHVVIENKTVTVTLDTDKQISVSL